MVAGGEGEGGSEFRVGENEVCPLLYTVSSMVSDRLCALTSLTAVTADCCVSADVTAIPVKLSDESVHTRDSRAGLVQSITASDMITVISNVIVTETVFAPPNSTLSATPVADLRAQMDRINTPVTILIKRRARDKEHSSQPNSIPSQEHMTLFLLLSLCTLVAGDTLPPPSPSPPCADRGGGTVAQKI